MNVVGSDSSTETLCFPGSALGLGLRAQEKPGVPAGQGWAASRRGSHRRAGPGRARLTGRSPLPARLHGNGPPPPPPLSRLQPAARLRGGSRSRLHRTAPHRAGPYHTCPPPPLPASGPPRTPAAPPPPPPRGTVQQRGGANLRQAPRGSFARFHLSRAGKANSLLLLREYAAPGAAARPSLPPCAHRRVRGWASRAVRRCTGSCPQQRPAAETGDFKTAAKVLRNTAITQKQLKA